MLPMASAVVLLPLYIKDLSTAMYGALSVYLVFTILVQLIVTFSFDSSIYIHYHEFKGDKKKLSVFISSAFVFMILLSIAVGLVLAVTGSLLFGLVLPDKDISFYPFGLASVGSGIFQAIFKVHNSLLQSREKAETFFWANVASFTLIAACIVVGLDLYPNSLIGPIMGRLVGTILPTLWVLFRVFREFGFHYDFGWLISSFGFNTYSFIYQLQQWFINQFDRILMLFFLPLADVGIYDFSVKCLIPIELIMNSLHTTIYPKVVSAVMEQQDKKSTLAINRYYHGLTAVIMLIVCGSILLLPIVIQLAIEVLSAKPEYLEAIQYAPYIAGIYFFKTMRLYFAAPYGILKYTKPLPVIYLVVSAIKIGLIVVLINRFNIYAIIIASFVSAVVEIILLRTRLEGRFQFKFNLFKIVMAPTILLLLILLLEPWVGRHQPVVVHLSYVIGCAGLLWWAYRNEIKLINPFSNGPRTA